MPNSGKPKPDITVFEASNDILKELYIGTTSQPIEKLEKDHKTQPPSAIAHWRPNHKVVYRTVESNLSPTDAAPFAKGYAAAVEKMGWRAIVD
jgi:hypothetical protein